MKILVCIKQVPDMESKFKINGTGNWYEETDLAFRINEYDEFAIEQAVQIKEQLGNEPDVTILTMGPERSKEALKKGLAMGCDRAVHILDDNYFNRDSFEVASLLAGFAKEGSFDLILTGMQSQDRGSGQVGILLAEMLGMPSVSTIVAFAYNDGQIQLKRDLEGGLKAEINATLPLLLTCQMGLNTPRYPTLPNIMKAKKKEMTCLAASDLDHSSSFATTTSFFFPEKSGSCLIIDGDSSSNADKLIELLKEKTAVLS